MTDSITEPLLSTSFAYVQAKRAFQTAITAARHAGWSDEQIARIAGITVDMSEAVGGERSPARYEDPRRQPQLGDGRLHPGRRATPSRTPRGWTVHESWR